MADTSLVPKPPRRSTLIIEDKDGNQWVILPNGTVVAAPHGGLPPKYNYSDDKLDATDSLRVDFTQKLTPSPQLFGFDARRKGNTYFKWAKNFEAIRLKGGLPYFVPYQSLGAATLTATSTQREEVVVNIKYLPAAGEPAFNASNLTFKLGTTVITDKDITTTTTGYTASFLFNLPAVPVGGTSGDEPFLYAYYGTKKIGKINIAPLKRREEKVILVPVNGATVPSVGVLQTYLDSVYRQANVRFTVIPKGNFVFGLGADASLERGGDGINKYSSEMRALRDAYITADATYDKTASYIFVIPSFTGGGLDGFMVRGRSMGFVASGANMRTYAHELGHGVFGLEHTFPEIGQSLSNNLMDYGDSTHLTHKQCKDIAKRKFVFNWLDSEEDGAFSNGTHLTPDWTAFNFKESNTYIGGGTIEQPNGAVFGIKHNNGKAYFWNNSQKKYIHNNNSTDFLILESVTGLGDKSIINLFWNIGRCGYNQGYRTTWGYIKDKRGFNVNNVTDVEKVTYIGPIPCIVNGISQGASLVEANCNSKDVATINSGVLKITGILNEVNQSIIIREVNDVDICSLQLLSYENIINLFKKLTNNANIGDDHEKAIVKLVASIKSEKFSDFFALVQEENNKILKNLMFKIDDKTFFYGANNYTNLVKLLLQMFNEVNKNVLQNSNSSTLIPTAYTVVQNSYLTPANGEPIFGITFQTNSSNLRITQGVWEVKNDCIWVSEVGGDGREECTTSKTIIYQTPVEVKPFDIAVLAKNSDYDLISGITEPNKKVSIVPAIILYYAHQKGEVNNIKLYLENTLDVATLLVPVTKIATGPKWLSKTFTFIDRWGQGNAAVH